MVDTQKPDDPGIRRHIAVNGYTRHECLMKDDRNYCTHAIESFPAHSYFCMYMAVFYMSSSLLVMLFFLGEQEQVYLKNLLYLGSGCARELRVLHSENMPSFGPQNHRSASIIVLCHGNIFKEM